jgi:hypothetical protein
MAQHTWKSAILAMAAGRYGGIGQQAATASSRHLAS